MKIIKPIQISTTEIEKVICDRCGVEHILSDLHEADFIECNHVFSYGSPRDGETVSFDICEKCFIEVLKISGIKARFEEPLWAPNEDLNLVDAG
jgi:hypothetical protein